LRRGLLQTPCASLGFSFCSAKIQLSKSLSIVEFIAAK